MSESKFDYTPEQKAAINHRGSALLVSAAAGSGKTKVLVERLLRRVCDGDDIDEFLVITYTRAAAAELRERIYDEISERLVNEPGNRRLRRQSLLCRGAQIGTIHSFCTEILRENAHLKGLPPDFRVADESESLMIKSEALENVLNDAYNTAVETVNNKQGEKKAYEPSPYFSELLDMVSTGRDDRRLVDIVLDVHARLQSNTNPRGWIEGQKEKLFMAGITDVSTTQWGAELLQQAIHTAQFWHDEMILLREEMRAFADFEKAYGASVDATAESIDAFRRALGKGWDVAKQHSEIDFPKVKAISGYDDLKDKRTKCKAAMKKCAASFECGSDGHIEDMRAVAPAMSALLQLILDFDNEYAETKRRRGVVDFSDLEHLTLALLVDSKTGEKTGLAHAVSKRFKEIMVDEYQDVNAVQECIFNAVSQDGNNIFMVGDVKQSIYRFRLADPGIFLEKYQADEDTNLELADQDRSADHGISLRQ